MSGGEDMNDVKNKDKFINDDNMLTKEEESMFNHIKLEIGRHRFQELMNVMETLTPEKVNAIMVLLKD